MFCSVCGSNIPDESLFCTKCGSKLNSPLGLDEKPIDSTFSNQQLNYPVLSYDQPHVNSYMNLSRIQFYKFNPSSERKKRTIPITVLFILIQLVFCIYLIIQSNQLRSLLDQLSSIGIINSSDPMSVLFGNSVYSYYGSSNVFTLKMIAFGIIMTYVYIVLSSFFGIIFCITHNPYWCVVVLFLAELTSVAFSFVGGSIGTIDFILLFLMLIVINNKIDREYVDYKKGLLKNT